MHLLQRNGIFHITKSRVHFAVEFPGLVDIDGILYGIGCKENYVMLDNSVLFYDKTQRK